MHPTSSLQTNPISPPINRILLSFDPSISLHPCHHSQNARSIVECLVDRLALDAAIAKIELAQYHKLLLGNINTESPHATLKVPPQKPVVLQDHESMGTVYAETA